LQQALRQQQQHVDSNRKAESQQQQPPLFQLQHVDTSQKVTVRNQVPLQQQQTKEAQPPVPSLGQPQQQPFQLQQQLFQQQHPSAALPPRPTSAVPSTSPKTAFQLQSGIQSVASLAANDVKSVQQNQEQQQRRHQLLSQQQQAMQEATQQLQVTRPSRVVVLAPHASLFSPLTRHCSRPSRVVVLLSCLPIFSCCFVLLSDSWFVAGHAKQSCRLLAAKKGSARPSPASESPSSSGSFLIRTRVLSAPGSKPAACAVKLAC
jgi:hypothetical protein